MRPFSISMDNYFRKYGRYLNSVQRHVKTIKPWKARAGIEVIASQLRKVLKETISNQCLYYSASSDIWTSRVNLLSFVSPYINPPYLVKACEILNIDSMSCLTHSLHSVVGSGIVKKKANKSSNEIMSAVKTDEDVGAAIDQVGCEKIDAFIDESYASSRADLERLRGTVDIFRRLAVYFSRSPKALDCLKSLQTRELTPQTDRATLWNSAHAMLLRMIELRSTLDEIFGHIARTREFSDSKLEKQPTMKNKEREKFEAITRSVGNKVSVPRVEALMQSVRQTYIKLFTEKFKNKLPGELLWISVLDPRSAELKHLSDEEAKTAISGFKLAVFDMGKEIKANRYSSHESTRVENESAVQLTTTSKNVAWLTEVFSGGTKMYVERAPTIADGKFKDECDSQVRQYFGDAHGTPVTTDALK
ncbi:Hypothetical protein PHPALM_215 [Phytophthora palmivora]|uniref:Uncharacterized protein n=1 Tax=Phytophthora palmivora TaxID=4796 RepID=A0A2P4YVF2_9STRA|nr:Hypothetical protein PHPALM_215 [Phytophthora palmivora]